MFGPTDRKLYLAYHQRPKELVVSSMHKQCLVSAAAAAAGGAAGAMATAGAGAAAAACDSCCRLDKTYTNW